MPIDFPNSPSVNDTHAVGDYVWKWNGTTWKRAPGPSAIDAKGDILAGTADNLTDRVPVGANNTVLVANSAISTGMNWSATVSGLTLTSATITAGIVDQLEENWYTANTAATGTIDLDVKTASAWYYKSDASGNWTLNVRGDATTSLSSLLAVDDTITVVFAVTQGTTAYYPTAFQVDGGSVTPKWQGGSAPTSGNAPSIDMYVYTILKTAATPTYTVFASQTQFK